MKLSDPRFSSIFTGEEFFLKDHIVNGQKVLPAVAYLEMARETVKLALGDQTLNIQLKNVVWTRPIIVEAESKTVHIGLFPDESGNIAYEIYTDNDNSEAIIHCQGVVVLETGKGEETIPDLDIEVLKSSCNQQELSSTECYKIFAQMGINYGPAHRGIEKIYIGKDSVLAKLKLPLSILASQGEFELHPSIMDSALQSSIGMMLGTSYEKPMLPFALHSLELFSPCTFSMWASIQRSQEQMSKVVQKFDIELLDGTGKVCVLMKGFSLRMLEESADFKKEKSIPSDQIEEATPSSIPKDQLVEKASHYFKKQLSTVLKLPIQKIESNESLEKYGIDSVMVIELTNELEKTFGSLSKTLFFEYQTIDELSQYFITSHFSKLAKLLRWDETETKKISTQASRPNLHHSSSHALQFGSAQKKEREAIAIVGISGRYPQSLDLKAYWENLRDGKDCITEIPASRWDWRKYYDQDAKEMGAHYSKWGGFIEGIDQFDPLFFNISPNEAVYLDPQERLFLEHVWMALEDAGLVRESLQRISLDDLPGQVGVYAGVMWSEYQLFGAEASVQGTPIALGNSFASIANRVSYVLNLHGPSMTVDTMCSSSLTSIHLACEDLKNGRTDVGIAGGVNVSIHPNKYLALSSGQFISKDGHCQSFGEGGDGYIPGEGVGVVILKRLSDAVADGDHIYGVIKGTATNHGGKTNGYTVPNPNAQQMVISRALKESKIDPRTISYVEAHGTGTKLGDPIEITGLTKAFDFDTTADTGYCALGSVKSNIGHCESAAGIAGVTKVLLQMQHRKIVPSLHSETLNRNIDFEKTPFSVNQKLRKWERPVVDGKEYPRIAGISSFGAGGSNAHIIIEEYIPEISIVNANIQATEISERNPALLVLSAKNRDRLREYAQKLLAFIRDEHNQEQKLSLSAMAYTLQVGREAMEERLGIIASSTEDLIDKLNKYISNEEVIEDLYVGQIKKNKEMISSLETDEILSKAVEIWIAKRNYSKLLEFWTKGLNVDWTKLYKEEKPKKISLPTYPFAKEKYWIEEIGINIKKRTQSFLHPLVQQNTSTLSEQKFSSTFTGEELFLRDQVVNSQRVFPNEAYLKMAREAVKMALEDPTVSIELINVVWATPIIFDTKPKTIHIGLHPEENGSIFYEIYTKEGTDAIIVHNQGEAVPNLGSTEQAKGIGTIMFSPAWKEKEIEKQVDAVIEVHLIRYDEKESTFEEKALDLFEQVQKVIHSKPKHEHLFQVVIKDPLEFGLSGILKTAHLENSKFHGQVILISNSARPIEEVLKENQKSFQDTEIWYDGVLRQIKELEEQVESGFIPPYKENGVYLITGGAGGLGLIFARDIVENIKSTTVILIGHSNLSSSKKEELRQLQTLAETDPIYRLNIYLLT